MPSFGPQFSLCWFWPKGLMFDTPILDKAFKLTAHVTDKSIMKTGRRCFHMSFGEHLWGNVKPKCSEIEKQIQSHISMCNSANK